MISKLDPEPVRPLNREAPLHELVSSFITQAPDAYNRNHSAIPEIDAATHVVSVGGDVPNPLQLSIEQLRHDFPQHEVLAALQCAGNRRHTMRTKLKEVVGLDWMDGAVMNCTWRGPRLRDILIKAGVKGCNNYNDDHETNAMASGAVNGTSNGHTAAGEKGPQMHVAFTCDQLRCQDDSNYGVSIELWRAMAVDREVILALEMNNKPLQPAYGYPVRVVVPGVAGARWVKWLDTISVVPHESPNFYQQHDYKILPPEALTWEIAEEYWPKVPAMQCMPVNSVVAVPNDDSTVSLPLSGELEIKGFAVPFGADGPVTRVEVSVDGGKTWVDTELDYGPHDSNKSKNKWAWVLWRAAVKVEKGRNKTIYSRATDAGGNTQQEMSPWNLRGVGYNGYGASWNVSVV
ncbi:sulfite oxidase [Histoplasma capsulatum var. duboisii H88]|uniref:Sulfite oxidase n=2 Tax=Ajellomyces capsulatus (strain H88) TaxID=544711 RepID=F0UP25_AJEC8|nr:sulfite oxidase [Histoplasma capsulatum var. duboisii H88]